MVLDAYEAHPLLLARWQGVEDLKKAINESFDYGGECCLVLEKLEKREISVGDAVDRISRIIDEIREKTQHIII